MTDFLTPVSTKKVNTKDVAPLPKKIQSLDIQDAVSVESTESALEALKSEPDWGTVNSVLRYLTSDGISLLLPQPSFASIAHQLVNTTIPSYWRTLKESNPQANQLVRILRNPTGLGHITTRLRSLITDNRQRKTPGSTRDTSEHIEDILDVLDRVLRDDSTSSSILKDIQTYGKNSMQKTLLWREYLSQTASGRILSVAAEAEDVLRKSGGSRDGSWVANGSKFAAWLGLNIAVLMKAEDMSEECFTAVVELCSKSLTLGYNGESTRCKGRCILLIDKTALWVLLPRSSSTMIVLRSLENSYLG